jgi:hypothetical protein
MSCSIRKNLEQDAGSKYLPLVRNKLRWNKEPIFTVECPPNYEHEVAIQTTPYHSKKQKLTGNQGGIKGEGAVLPPCPHSTVSHQPLTQLPTTPVLPKRPREIKRARDFVLRFSLLVSHSHENCMNVNPPS